ncbi:MAG: hypothetical protein QXI16_00985 [Sulfolobaceae archaeon]
MAVVRSLLISLGFNIDRKSQNRAEKSINNVKENLKETGKEVKNVDRAQRTSNISWYKSIRRNLALWGVAIYAVQRFGNALYNVSNNIFKEDILARTIGITRNELKALNDTASEFGFDGTEFTDVLGRFNKRLEDAKNGLDDFTNLNRQFNISIDPNLTALQNLYTVLESIGEITDEISRRQQLEAIFGGFGIPLSDISQNLSDFQRNVGVRTTERSLSNEDINTTREYRKAVIKLSQQWELFMQRLAPQIIILATNLNKILDFADKVDQSIWSSFTKGKVFDNSGTPAAWMANFAMALLPPPITINNNITVPAGSTEEQANYLNNEIERSARETFFNFFKIMQSDYPRLE